MGRDVDFSKLPKSAVEPLKEGERFWDFWEVNSLAIYLDYSMRNNYMVLDLVGRVLCEGDERPELWQSEYYQITAQQLDRIIELCRAGVETAEDDEDREYVTWTFGRLEELRKEFDFESNHLVINWC